VSSEVRQPRRTPTDRRAGSSWDDDPRAGSRLDDLSRDEAVDSLVQDAFGLGGRRVYLGEVQRHLTVAVEKRQRFDDLRDPQRRRQR
jgi:hypothetical protein